MWACRAHHFNMKCMNQAGFLITEKYFIHLKKQNSQKGAATPFPSDWGKCKCPWEMGNIFPLQEF